MTDANKAALRERPENCSVTFIDGEYLISGSKNLCEVVKKAQLYPLLHKVWTPIGSRAMSEGCSSSSKICFRTDIGITGWRLRRYLLSVPAVSFLRSK